MDEDNDGEEDRKSLQQETIIQKTSEYSPQKITDFESKSIDSGDDKGGWPDWEGMENKKDMTEEDYDQQIENELNAMDSTMAPDLSKKMSCDSDTESSPSRTVSQPVQNDGLGAVREHKMRSESEKRGILKLKGLKSKSSPPPEEVADWRQGAAKGDRKQAREHDDGHSNYINNKNDNIAHRGNDWTPDESHIKSDHLSNKNKPTKSVVGKVRNPKPLGEEFDILSLDIKTKKDVKESTSELNFFSDMEPQIIAKSSLLETLAAAAAQNKTPEKDSSKTSPGEPHSKLSFAVQEVGDPEGVSEIVIILHYYFKNNLELVTHIAL